jgi:hypothetical protein
MRVYIEGSDWWIPSHRFAIHSGMSQETECFEAQLYRGDEFVGRVWNEGTGGPDGHTFSSRQTYDELKAEAEKQPPITWTDHEGVVHSFPCDIDTFVGRLLAEAQNRKRAAKYLTICKQDDPNCLLHIKYGRRFAKADDVKARDEVLAANPDFVEVKSHRVTANEVTA